MLRKYCDSQGDEDYPNNSAPEPALGKEYSIPEDAKHNRAGDAAWFKAIIMGVERTAVQRKSTSWTGLESLIGFTDLAAKFFNARFIAAAVANELSPAAQQYTRVSAHLMQA